MIGRSILLLAIIVLTSWSIDAENCKIVCITLTEDREILIPMSREIDMQHIRGALCFSDSDKDYELPIEDIVGISVKEDIVSSIGNIYFEPNSEWQIYDISGKLCAEGKGEIPIDSLPGDAIYIVRSSSYSYKIHKKR